MVDYKSLHNNKLGEPKTLTPGPQTLPSNPGACFSKLLKLFGRISGDIVLLIKKILEKM